jgi:hypothetical protein
VELIVTDRLPSRYLQRPGQGYDSLKTLGYHVIDAIVVVVAVVVVIAFVVAIARNMVSLNPCFGLRGGRSRLSLFPRKRRLHTHMLDLR